MSLARTYAASLVGGPGGGQCVRRGERAKRQEKGPGKRAVRGEACTPPLAPPPAAIPIPLKDVVCASATSASTAEGAPPLPLPPPRPPSGSDTRTTLHTGGGGKNSAWIFFFSYEIWVFIFNPFL